MGWVPAPRYVLRRYCVLRMLRNLEAGRFLELGCGAGELMTRLARAGYSGTGCEFSEQARAEARSRAQPWADRLEVVGDLSEVRGEFDLLVSCEVLEHIEDDRQALRDWVEFLKPGGHVILSVPSHMKRWGPSDVWAGHFRRYERDELVQKLAEVDVEVEALWCYGFPLANMVSPLREYIYARRLAREKEMTPKQRTQRSGVERDKLTRAASFLMADAFMRPWHWLQLAFLNTEVGNGYLVLGRKKLNQPSVEVDSEAESDAETQSAQQPPHQSSRSSDPESPPTEPHPPRSP